MAIPPLVLRIVADATQARAELAKTQGTVGKMQAGVTQASSRIRRALAFGLAGGAAIAIKAASDLGESQNKANVIFGKSVGVVNRFSRTAATGFGIAGAEALEAAGSFGAMFDSAGLVQQASAEMSVTMSGLAGDMASFNNTDPSEMLERLRSGLAGEAEPLRRFGVFISEARVQTEAYRSGIAKAGEELTDAQKIQARYNIILADTKRQQGDFARTSKSLPNQLRALRAEALNLAAELGKALLPVMQDLVGMVRGAVKWFKSLSPEQRKMLIAAVALTVALKPLVSLVRGLGGALGGLRRAFGLTTAATAAWTAAIALVGVAAVKLHGYLKMDDEQAQKWATSVRKGEASLADYRREVARVTGSSNLADIWNGDRQALSALEQTVDQVNRDYRTHVGLLLETSDAYEKWNPLLRNAGDMSIKQKANLAALLNVTADYNVKLSRSQEVTLEAFLAAGDYKSALNLLKGALNGVLGPLKNALTYTERQAEAAADAAQKNQRYVYWLKQIGNVNPGPPPPLPSAPPVGGQQRQHGGPVGAMRPYIVGEAGPELFIPRISGQIVSNEALGGGTPNIAVYIGGERFEEFVVRSLNKAGRR